MLFVQVMDEDLGCASYLIGDEEAGVAVVVDPSLSVDPLLREVERRGLLLTHVLETHTHADHVSGHGRLGLELELPVYVHPAADPEFPYRSLADGQKLEVGAVVLTVLHTPGHRPEHCSFTVTDRSRADEPWLVLTGDSLFVGEAARPDLAVNPLEGARGLRHSLRRLGELADGVEVHPGHVAGSMCGAGMSAKPSSTIGFERRFNPAFVLSNGLEEDFLAASAAGAGLRPPNVERIVALNRGPFLAAPPPLRPVGSAGDALVLDVRPARVSAAGHIPGAINVPLETRGFGTRAGFVLLAGEAVVLHAASPQQAQLAAQRLHAVGYLELAGYLEGASADERLDSVELDDLERLLEQGEVDVLDVREADERDAGYIPGSRHVPYRLVRALGGELGGGRPVITICESGARAGVAASILAAAGVDARPVLDGGRFAWRARGNETIEFRRCGG